MVNAQEWLESQEECNTKEKREKITVLNFLRNRNLEGNLDLSDFINIRKLDCYGNKLTSLNISNCYYLTWSSCGDNSLTRIILPNNHTNLKELSLNNNNFPSQDLSFLVPYINLEYLWLGDNNFTGSLQHLSNMKKLRKLDIRDTNIDRGLEYLPESIREFCCSTEERTYAKVKIIEKDWNHFNRNLKKCREFNNSLACKWLDKNYPEEGECERETGDWGWDDKLGWNNEGKKRRDIAKLDVSSQELKGGLRLKGFTGLKSLNCSNNQLTDLDLTDCKELIELKCDKNNLENLNFSTPLTKLKELDISDCLDLKGSLKSLENMIELEKIFINHTNISEGLDDLPDNCKELYCDLDYKYNSTEIVKQLNKFSEKNQDDKTYYNLGKWRENKQNDLAVSIISPERLFTIRSNIKQFMNKWGKKGNDNLNELDKLQPPEELYEYYRWRIYTSQFVGRGAAVTGAILTFQDQGAIGGGILGIYPFAELVVSRLEKSLEDKKNKWKEFLVDADTFLDNYNGLLGILSQFEISELKKGEINKALRDLDEKVKKFLETYDKDDNEEIDVNELIKERDKLTEDLNKWDEEKEEEKEKSELKNIINAVKKLEKAVIEYRRLSYYGIRKEATDKPSQIARTTQQSESNSEVAINLDEYFEKKQQSEVQIQIPPK